MEQDMRKEAVRQYLHYFRFWFIAVIAMAVILIGSFVLKMMTRRDRANSEAPVERVYDYADVLTDAEENKLRQYIAKQEKKHGMDIVLVTMAEDVEQYGDWETAMQDLADEIYDDMKYGYDRVHGDGILLLDNWYEGQEGSWLSTCGRVYERFGVRDVNRVLDAVYEKVDDSPYKAYHAYVKESVSSGRSASAFLFLFLLVPPVVAGFFVYTHLYQKKSEDTTTATTFVENGKPSVRDSRDEFINKKVTSVRISTSSGGSSGSGGRAGGHRSSSGVRHGGGGRRR